MRFIPRRCGLRAVWCVTLLVFAVATIDPCPDLSASRSDPIAASTAERAPDLRRFCPCHATDAWPAAAIAGDVLAPPTPRWVGEGRDRAAHSVAVVRVFRSAPLRLPEPIPISVGLLHS